MGLEGHDAIAQLVRFEDEDDAHLDGAGGLPQAETVGVIAEHWIAGFGRAMNEQLHASARRDGNPLRIFGRIMEAEKLLRSVIGTDVTGSTIATAAEETAPSMVNRW